MIPGLKPPAGGALKNWCGSRSTPTRLATWGRRRFATGWQPSMSGFPRAVRPSPMRLHGEPKQLMSMALDFFTINKRRAVMKIPVISLCAQAGVGVRTYYNNLNSKTDARPDTLAKLNHALDRFKLSYAGDKGPLAVHVAYKLALVIAAGQLKADARETFSADPARKATADAEWLAAARVRRLAFWIINQIGGFGVTDVARAAGVTKQAVSSAIKELESDEDPEMQRVLQHLEELFS